MHKQVVDIYYAGDKRVRKDLRQKLTVDLYYVQNVVATAKFGNHDRIGFKCNHFIKFLKTGIIFFFIQTISVIFRLPAGKRLSQNQA